MIKQGIIISIKGNLYEYDQYDERAKMHIAHAIMVDDVGRLTATYDAYAFTDEELKDNAVNFTNFQWCGIVEHFIRQAYDLTKEEMDEAIVDIVFRGFAYGKPTIEELPEYIAEYMNR